jgi:hypothetical protein
MSREAPSSAPNPRSVTSVSEQRSRAHNMNPLCEPGGNGSDNEAPIWLSSMARAWKNTFSVHTYI